MRKDGQFGRRTVLKATGATVTAGLVGMAGCLGDDSSESEAITITLSQFPDVEDPNDHITGDYFNVFDQIYEPLFDIEAGDTPESRVAEDWEHGDGSVDVTLRDDVQFHNGDSLTAEDVAFTLRRQIDPEFGPETDQAAGLGSITGAEAVDEQTVRFEYSGTSQLAEFEFGNYARAVNREWALERGGDEGGFTGDGPDAFNGTGPYEVVSYTPEEEIVLERFDDYWGEEAPFSEVTFNADNQSGGRRDALLADETDLTINILPEDVDAIQNEDGVEIRAVTSFRTIFCTMKNTVPPFDSLEFRRAINLAVDTQAIVDEFTGGFGEPTSQPVAPGINGYDSSLEPFAYDQAQAEELIEQSGYAGESIELLVPDGRYLNDTLVGQRIVDELNSLSNLSCELEIREFPEVSSELATGMNPDNFEFPFLLIGWGVITGDTDYGVSAFFLDGPLQTFQDQELQDALVESKGIDDAGQREQALQEVNTLARQKAPFLFLHVQPSIYGVDADIEWDPRPDETIFTWEMDI